MKRPFAADPSAVRGAITPLVTPFHRRRLARPRLDRPLIDWQLERGSHGISVGGSTGEPTSQTVAERIEVMRAAVAAIDGRVPFLPGTGTARLDETLELTAEAQRLGARGRARRRALLRAAAAGGLFEWYARVAPRVPRPADHRLQRPIRSAVDITPRDGRPAAPRARRTSSASRRRRATSSTSPTCSTSAARDFIALSGIELLCYPMLVPRRRRPPLLRRELRAASRSPSSTTRSSPATTSARASCTTSCTRSSTPRSPRPTRCRRSGSCTAWGSCRRRSRAEPLAPLSEAGQKKVLDLLAGSPWMREVVAA